MWKCEVLLIALTGAEPNFSRKTLETSWPAQRSVTCTGISTPKYFIRSPAAGVQFGSLKPHIFISNYSRQRAISFN